MASPRFRKALLLYGIETEQVSTLKQTDTTPAVEDDAESEGSERSRSHENRVLTRESDAEPVLGPVAKPIADSYGSSPFSASHYGLEDSIAQKVSALAGRDRTRDLFDLAMLLERYAKDVGSVTALHPPSEEARAALKRASEMTFDAYKAEVLPYLEKSRGWNTAAGRAGRRRRRSSSKAGDFSR